MSCLIFSKEILLFLILVKVPHNQVEGAKTVTLSAEHRC